MQKGLAVVGVDPSGKAAELGFQQGDIILKAGNRSHIEPWRPDRRHLRGRSSRAQEHARHGQARPGSTLRRGSNRYQLGTNRHTG